MQTIENTLATGLDMSTDFFSPSQILYLDNAYLQAVWDGNPGGTLMVQTSADNIIFTDYTISEIMVTEAGDASYLLLNAQYKYVRLKWIAASGSGSMSIKHTSKGDYP